MWDVELILNYIKITTSGSANSKYAFLGSLRSTAQLISYELILSSALLLVIMLTGSLNLTVNIEAQRAVWFVLPLFPLFLIFFIGSIAETNRPPFDLAEANHHKSTDLVSVIAYITAKFIKFLMLILDIIRYSIYLNLGY